MREMSDQDKIEEIYLILSDLRYLLHRESNTFEEYEKIAVDYWKRISVAAAYAREMLPEEG